MKSVFFKSFIGKKICPDTYYLIMNEKSELLLLVDYSYEVFFQFNVNVITFVEVPLNPISSLKKLIKTVFNAN